MVKRKIDTSTELMASHELRCTRQRRALLDALRATKSHPTAEQLYRSAGSKSDGMSLATVYNTLEAFCKAGLAQRLPSPQGSARYDATVENHVHLRDEVSEAVIDLPEELSQRVLDSLPKALLNKLEGDMHFKIRQIEVVLVGERI